MSNTTYWTEDYASEGTLVGKMTTTTVSGSTLTATSPDISGADFYSLSGASASLNVKRLPLAAARSRKSCAAG